MRARWRSALSPAALTRVALDYAHAVHAGRLDPSDFSKDWGIRPQPYDPLPGFADAVQRDRLAAWVASLPPPYAGYDALVTGLAHGDACQTLLGVNYKL